MVEKIIIKKIKEYEFYEIYLINTIKICYLRNKELYEFWVGVYEEISQKSFDKRLIGK